MSIRTVNDDINVLYLHCDITYSVTYCYHHPNVYCQLLNKYFPDLVKRLKFRNTSVFKFLSGYFIMYKVKPG